MQLTVRLNKGHFSTFIFSSGRESRHRSFSVGCLLLLLCAGVSQVFAQDDEVSTRRGSRIVDDTTKQIYGPNTSRYFYESDIFFNRERIHPIDTLIRNFHRFTYVQQNSNLYQDLGNIGTAIQPIFYRPPDVIGARSGAHVYDLYWDSEQIRYFDTKSPYSIMRVILGGKGRSITRATFSRNINPRWNFGFTYRGLLIDKQIFRRGKGDRTTRSNYYDAFTTYQNKDSTYRLFANFRRSFHRVNEFGGVKLLGNDTVGIDGYFAVNARPFLTTGIESNDLRMNLHLFHQYSIGKGLQLYHTFDRYRQKNNFLDINDQESEDFFDAVEIDQDTARDVTKFKTVRNEAGIKGNLSKLFYNGYFAIRHYSMSYNNVWVDTLRAEQKIQTIGDETYLGGRIALQLDSLNEVNGWLEVMKSGYRLEGEITSKWFDARLTQMRYHPGFVPQLYRGAHDFWASNMANIETTRVNGYVHYRSSVLKLSPGLTFTRLRNYVYFRKISDVDTVQQVSPFQSGGNQIIASPEVRLAMTFFRHITWSSQVVYTRLLENADNAIQVPDLLINTQLSYDNIFFNGNLDMHAGVDLHWKSAYYAPGYDVAARQFFNQQDFEVPAFPLVDVFFSAKIKRGRVFFKYHNLIQAITKQGYLPTPFYPGQSNTFDFGFDWSFYD